MAPLPPSIAWISTSCPKVAAIGTSMPSIATSTPSRTAECTASRIARARSVRSIWTIRPVRPRKPPSTSLRNLAIRTVPRRARNMVQPTYRLVPYSKTDT